MDDPKNNLAHLLCYFKLFASLCSDWWIQTGGTVRKHQIWVKFDDFLAVPCDLEIWLMTLKTIGHLFYPISSFVYHFIPIGEFKLELQSGNAQFGSKLTIFFRDVTFKLDRWSWKTIGHLFYATSSFAHHFVPIGEFKVELESGNTQFGSKSMTFFSCVTFNLDGWPWKTIGHHFYDTLSFVHHFNAIGKFKLKLKSKNTPFGSKSMIFLAARPTNLRMTLKNK